jgi:hypothetical protein
MRLAVAEAQLALAQTEPLGVVAPAGQVLVILLYQEHLVAVAPVVKTVAAPKTH